MRATSVMNMAFAAATSSGRVLSSNDHAAGMNIISERPICAPCPAHSVSCRQIPKQGGHSKIQFESKGRSASAAATVDVWSRQKGGSIMTPLISDGFAPETFRFGYGDTILGT